MNWSIAQLERNTTDNGVIVAHWRVNAEETVGDITYTASSYGTCGFTPDPTAPDFVPFESLTETDVLQWVYAELGAEQLAAIEDGLSANIEEQKAPQTLVGTPW